MEAIQLQFRGEVIREFALDGRALDVGRSPYCDIVVHDVGVADRQLMIRSEGGTVMAYDLASAPGRRRASVVSFGRPIRVGEHHALVRTTSRDIEPEPRTAQIPRAAGGHDGFVVAVGPGRERRAVVLGDTPVSIGSDSRNAIVINDRCVSAHHVRLEATVDGVLIRDLGSKNGTYVDGSRVHAVEVSRSVVVRIGRTDVRIDRCESPLDGDLVARSTEFRAVLSFVDRVARMPFPVLILGESGSGKEAIARRIHDESARASGPYVAINAAAISPHLVESQLFGHERGAFTGALTAHRGVFQQADRGTLFLDEIGELPLELQARLLRVLDTMEVRRVGAEKAERVDVRLVCATHRPLAAMVERGEFRRDLFFRIAHLPVAVPPLRDRPDDIVPLARHILRREAVSIGTKTLTQAACQLLERQAWHGNVRELRNVLISAAASSALGELDAVDVERVLASSLITVSRSRSDAAWQHTLEQHRGNVSSASRALGIPRTTLRDWMKRASASSADDE